ncbi:MAG: hypothetical protein LBT51_00880 [Fusobacteriaceae bacterium]|nr:hypothetical protein [Fusobacteriaceae bacterium]
MSNKSMLGLIKKFRNIQTMKKKRDKSDELRLDLDGTIFRFSFSDKGSGDDEYFWADACISVKNRYFNYQVGPEFLAFEELQEINKRFTELVNDCITEKCEMEFIEPDLQIVLIPKFEIENDPEDIHIKEWHEIIDISAEFIFFLSLDDGYTDQHYTLPLYRSDIKSIIEFLDKKIRKINKI